jgi:diguanylate cyclase (GGDEF)-like protein
MPSGKHPSTFHTDPGLSSRAARGISCAGTPVTPGLPEGRPDEIMRLQLGIVIEFALGGKTVSETRQEHREEIGHNGDLSQKHSPNRQVLEFVKKKNGGAESLDEALAAALQAADTEFGDILREVNQILQVLKSPNPSKETLRIAEHPAVWSAMKQALLDRELRQLALTDDLTCLFNRRGFFAAATQQLKRAMRKSERLLLFFCDLDGLKQINDTIGHGEGDMALIRVAEVLEKSFRRSDIVARLGGDEFVVLAVETGEGCEEAIQRRIARNLKGTKSMGCGCELSLSVGVARFNPKQAVSLGELMSEADKAMYEQKRKRQALRKT